jgi:hypothetical protein
MIFCYVIVSVNYKVVLAPIRAPITAMITGGSALCTGADGPRPGDGRSATWRRARVPF